MPTDEPVKHILERPAKRRRSDIDGAAADKEVAGLPTIRAALNFGEGTHTKRKDGSVIDHDNNVSTTIFDGRADPSRFSVRQHGFALVPARTVAARVLEIDVYDPDAFVRGVFPACERLAMQHCEGATRAIAFDHLVRNKDRWEKEQVALQHFKNGHGEGAVEPILTPFLSGGLANVHGDYTARSGLMRASQLLKTYVNPDMLEKALGNRIAIINVWVPFEKVQCDTSLAMCTWNSCCPHDVETNRMKWVHRVGETYKALSNNVTYQRWVYFSDVKPGEAILLKTFDSLDDGHTSRFCIHTGFHLPTPGPPCRKSAEVRVLVLWGSGMEDLAKEFIPPHVDPNSEEAKSSKGELDGSALMKKEILSFAPDW